MTSAIFLVLVCLGPFAVMGDSYSWVPRVAKTASQQCIDFGENLVGKCVVRPEVARKARNYTPVGICLSLMCAKSLPTGGHEIVRKGRPITGTPCGASSFCDRGECVFVPTNRKPSVEGSDTTFNCLPI